MLVTPIITHFMQLVSFYTPWKYLWLYTLYTLQKPLIITTAQLHSTKPELRFCTGSNPARSVSEIRSGEDLWHWSWLEIRLNGFRWSTIPQNNLLLLSSSSSSSSTSPEWIWVYFKPFAKHLWWKFSPKINMFKEIFKITYSRKRDNHRLIHI